MKRRTYPAIVIAILALAPGVRAADGIPQFAKPSVTSTITSSPSTPPLNGAASVQEIYGDWTVVCSVTDGKTACVVSQAQGHRKTGEQVFGIQLHSPQGGVAQGVVLMPFGLQLDAGAILKIDGTDLGDGLRFSTCRPQGCFMPVKFTTTATDAIAKASMFTVSSLDLNSGAPVTFNVSTNGFRTALDRATELGR